MMQTPHPSADVAAYKQSPRRTRIHSGCWIHGWQHCLSLHLPLRLSSVQVELCAYWTCKCSEILLQKCWERTLWASVLKISSHGSSHGRSTATAWIGVGNNYSLHVGISCLHKAGNVLVISQRNTLTLNSL